MVLFRMEQMRHDSLNGHLYYVPKEGRDLGIRLLGYMNGREDHSAEQKERLLKEVFGGREGMARLMDALEESEEQISKKDCI